ncbi:MAG: PHP domain-containing protein [Candidatus Sumerlaeaceae bacterium]
MNSEERSDKRRPKSEELLRCEAIPDPRPPKPELCFVHLHAHSYYSFFDSTFSPEDLVTLACKHGHKAVALTDINCMTGAVVFYKAAKQAGLNPILGAEITQPLPNERKLLRDRAAAEFELRNLEARSERKIEERGAKSQRKRTTEYTEHTDPDNLEFKIQNSKDVSSGSLSPALCQGDKSKRAVLLARSFDAYSEISAVVTRRMLDPMFDLFREMDALSDQVIILSDSTEVLEHTVKGKVGIGDPQSADGGAMNAKDGRDEANSDDGSNGSYETVGSTVPRDSRNSYASHSSHKTHTPHKPHFSAPLYALLTASRRCRARNRLVYESARRLGIPLVAGCDVKLGTPDDAQLHHLLQAMRRLTTVYQLSDAQKIDPAHHFQSAEQVARFFGLDRTDRDQPADEIFAHLREGVANTSRIAELCHCELPLNEWKFPKLPGTPVPSPEKELRRLVIEGMHKRYGDPLPPLPRDRMNSEMEIIEKLGFTEYFLLVNRIVSEAHRRGFFTVGRGSGANSILSYALGFTEVCPLKFNLYFERFLNPDRSVPPDIDIDFSWKERDELLQWCFEYFGRDRVALICTIQTLQARQSIREVGKAFGLSENEVNAFNRLHETGFRVEEEVKSELGNEGRRAKSKERRIYNLAEQEPWSTVLKFAQRITGFPRHLSIHCGGILITPDTVTKFLPLTRSAKGFAITQMDMFSVEELGLIKIDLLSNRSLGVLKDALRMAERNLNGERMNTIPGGAPHLPESAGALLPENAAKVEVFQREAMRMKLAGTRRGTSVALAGVLGSFATCVQNTVANELVPHGAAITLREQALSFHSVTNDPVTRQIIDQGLTMGCFYVESPGMRALFERLRCKNFEEVVTASSIIRPGVAESGMMQEYIARHQEKNPENYEVQTSNYQVVEADGKSHQATESRHSKFKIQNSESGPDNQLTVVRREMLEAAAAEIEPLGISMQMSTLQRETERAGMIGSRSGTRVAVALDLKTGFADPRSPTTLLPPSSASERLANGAMPINAHAKSRALEEYLLPSSNTESDRPIISCHSELKASQQAAAHESGSKLHELQSNVEAVRGYTIEPQGRSAANTHGASKKLRIHHVMMEMLPETYGVMVYQEDVLRVAHDLAGMSYAEADLLRRAISGKMRSRDALLAIQDHFVAGVMGKGLPREDAEEIWRQMASFAGYSFCKGHSAAFAVLSYQVAFMKAHYPAEFFAGVLTNEGGFYGAHAYLQEARRWGIEIQPPCVNASRLEYVGLTLNAAAARTAAGLQTEAPRQIRSEGSSESHRSDASEGAGTPDSSRACQDFPVSPKSHSPFPLPLGTGRAGWLRVGLMAVQGVRQQTKEQIVESRDQYGPFASLEDLMDRTDAGLEECRAFIMTGAMDCLADDALSAEPWKPSDPRRVLHKRRALLLKTECLFHARNAGITDGFVKLTFPISHSKFRIPDSSSEPGTQKPDRIAALQELSRLEAEILNFTLSAHPLDLVDIPSEVIPARDIRTHNHKRIYMAGWMISAKLIATRTSGQAMKMLTLEDKSGTFEAVLFPRVYARYAPRTLGRGPYLVCGKVDMTLGSPTLNVEKIDILPNRRD